MDSGTAAEHPPVNLEKSEISGKQFACFRILFGLYLSWHFAGLLPYAGELFSREGVLPEARLNLAFGLFPDPLFLWDSPGQATFWVGLCLVLSLLLAIGWKRSWVALLLWFGWACLFHRNNLISNPSIPYVGLLLVLSALVPPGEPWVWGRDHEKSEVFQFPSMIYWTAWILMAIGYGFSGWCKLASPSWLDGTALLQVLNNPLARPGWLPQLLLGLPQPFFCLMTWSVLALELAFLPLSLWARGRAFVWIMMVLMHLGIMMLIDFSDLSLGMLMLQAFTFDPRWLPAFGKYLPIFNFQNNLKI